MLCNSNRPSARGRNAARLAHRRPPAHRNHQTSRASSERHDSSSRHDSPSVPPPPVFCHKPRRHRQSFYHLAKLLLRQTVLPHHRTIFRRLPKIRTAVTAVTLTIEMAAAMAASVARLNKNQTLRVSIETTGAPSSVSKLWTAWLTRTASP